MPAPIVVGVHFVFEGDGLLDYEHGHADGEGIGEEGVGFPEDGRGDG